MSDIQRWQPQRMGPKSEGMWVLWEDHVDALAQAEQECGERSHGHYMDGYEQGQRDALAAYVCPKCGEHGHSDAR